MFIFSKTLKWITLRKLNRNRAIKIKVWAYFGTNEIALLRVDSWTKLKNSRVGKVIGRKRYCFWEL